MSTTAADRRFIFPRPIERGETRVYATCVTLSRARMGETKGGFVVLSVDGPTAVAVGLNRSV